LKISWFLGRESKEISGNQWILAEERSGMAVFGIFQPDYAASRDRNNGGWTKAVHGKDYFAEHSTILISSGVNP